MGIGCERFGRRAPAIHRDEGVARDDALIAGMRRMGMGLPAHLIARQQCGDGARIALPASLKQGQSAIAMPEKTDHGGHAVMGAAQ